MPTPVRPETTDHPQPPTGKIWNTQSVTQAPWAGPLESHRAWDPPGLARPRPSRAGAPSCPAAVRAGGDPPRQVAPLPRGPPARVTPGSSPAYRPPGRSSLTDPPGGPSTPDARSARHARHQLSDTQPHAARCVGARRTSSASPSYGHRQGHHPSPAGDDDSTSSEQPRWHTSRQTWTEPPRTTRAAQRAWKSPAPRATRGVASCGQLTACHASSSVRSKEQPREHKDRQPASAIHNVSAAPGAAIRASPATSPSASSPSAPGQPPWRSRGVGLGSAHPCGPEPPSWRSPSAAPG